MKNTILTIKFHRPGTQHRLVNRQRLIQYLDDGLDSGRLLTLVSAPAGFGKTTCVTAWVDRLDIPVIWLSLDPADDDPVRFFSYFIAGLQQLDPGLGKEIDNFLNKEQLPPIDTIASALTNEVAGLNRRILYVLDDFQAIQDPLVLKVLEKIIAHQPRQLHFVLITREDPLLPLARLRANNLLTEVRSGDLRFSSNEISQFFEEVMDLPLGEADRIILESHTEGWIAGLQLAGLSLRGRNNPSSFIANISGSHRHILSYLTEEVLDRQSEEVRAFLLKTSILEKLNGDLCDAVTGRSDSTLMLEQLLHANLFLVPLDNEQRWYRYHHLFADLLRTMLNRAFSEAIQPLHQRASQWFAEAGMISEAIEHALQAENYRQAVELIELHAMSIVMQGYVKTVERWFQSIPTEWHHKSPRARIALAGTYLLSGNYHLVEQYLKQSEQIIRPDARSIYPTLQDIATLRAEWFAIKSTLLNIQGNAPDSIAMAQQALLEARPDDHYIKGIAYLGLGGAYRIIDNYPGLVDAYQKSIHHSRIASKPLPEMLSANALARIAIQHGDLHFAEEVAVQVINRISDRLGFYDESLPPVAGSIYGALGMVCYEWNHLDQARGYYQQALQLSEVGGHNAGVVFAHILRSRLSMAEGDLSAAAMEIHKAVERIPLGVPAWLTPECLAQQVRVDLSRGNLNPARAILDHLGVDWHSPIVPQSELDYLTYLRCMLFEARETPQSLDLSPVIQIASDLINAAQKGDRVSTLLPALLLRAQIQAVLGDRFVALDDIALAVDRAKPGGYIRTFIDEGPALIPLLRDSLTKMQHRDYGEHLLACFLSGDKDFGSETPAQTRNHMDANSHAERSAPLEPLSEREMEVLGLIAQGLKYEQIAEKLVISVNTVRFYIKAIYSKLQVNNRSQAVAIAHQFGML